ncbi:hypothetical protein [Pontibacter chitinilyticus]|uniref:hypothetical protein n=1 Tax=Pontibacter chitinilyticus TaxID=2674989 RepID=UPI003219CFA1
MTKNLLLFLLAAFVLLSCSKSNDNLREKLEAAVTKGEVGAKGYKTVQLADLTDFDWDTVYYFNEQEDAKYISDVVGFRWEGAAVPPQNKRLLFVKDGKVVSYVDYKYQDFPLFVYGCNEDRWIFPRSRTNFATFKYCEQDSVVYQFIPVACAENLRELMGHSCPDKEATAAK